MATEKMVKKERIISIHEELKELKEVLPELIEKLNSITYNKVKNFNGTRIYNINPNEMIHVILLEVSIAEVEDRIKELTEYILLQTN